MYRWQRVLVCLVLVCCILVNLSPLRAKAVDALTVSAIGAGLAITTALVGLGLQAGGTSKALQEISGSAVTALESGAFGEFITDGMVNAVKYNRGDGTYGFALSLGLLEALKTWIFGEGIVTNDSSVYPVEVTLYDSSGEVDTIGQFSYPTRIIGFKTESGGSSIGFLTYGYDSFSVIKDGKTYSYYARELVDLGNGVYWKNIYGSTDDLSRYYTGVEWLSVTSLDALSYDDLYPLSTSYDLTLGNVGTADQTVEEAHSDWVAGSITVPGSLVGSDTEEKYVPVGLPATQEEALGKTQEEVQSGVGTYDDTIADTETDSDTVTGTGTIADVIAEIKALPTTFADTIAEVIAAVQAIPAAIADVFTPSADIDHFSISLSDYFPFCIPFDLYDFLTCLNADPVAPVIEWEIYLPGGSTYPLELDLSVFDPVAQLLRRLELLLFCVGLAFKTRDLIKG